MLSKNSKPFVEPVIKWSGSKRTIAPILARMLPVTERYFEPFVGGGALLPFKKSKIGIAGDTIKELIQLWIAISDEPELTANEYEKRWMRLHTEGYEAYYAIRDSFNVTRNPYDLLFLSRTCVNGLIRFNQNGDFNNSLHHTRPGISPAKLRRVIYLWSYIIRDVKFISADYRETLSTVREGDFIFLDPPYAGTKGRYIPNKFRFEEFFHELERLNRDGAKWLLTFDGVAGERRYVSDVPRDLYRVKIKLQTGNSPFPKLMKTGVDGVIESVYLNFDPPSEVLSEFSDDRNKRQGRITEFDVEQGTLFTCDKLNTESNIKFST